MAALLSLLGSKDFHLSSIILENNGITVYLWTYLAHSAGKTLCMTMLWFSLLTKYCEKNTERSIEKNIVRKYCPAFSNLGKFWQGKLESCAERDKEQELDLPTEQIGNHYFLFKATNKNSPFFHPGSADLPAVSVWWLHIIFFSWASATVDCSAV